ncbi:MAG: NAD-dependent epimerase/dehydratase family protein, partial [Gammaproteobacteria bacterium]|nr:NAD-dependent epimerase/dehydratase family protein [Gammaproteobacteria bacterium]
MKIIIFGHTGMLGKALIKHLRNTHEIIGISRKTNSKLPIENHLWQDLSNVLEKNKFDVAINLCGESIGQPWHQWSRQKIYDSRINVTKGIVNALSNKDIHLINAGGVGIYDANEFLQKKAHEENINPVGFLQ